VVPALPPPLFKESCLPVGANGPIPLPLPLFPDPSLLSLFCAVIFSHLERDLFAQFNSVFSAPVNAALVFYWLLLAIPNTDMRRKMK
jgi:hypothetical protein